MTISVLIAVTHLLGAGHLTRAAALGRALVEAGHEATIVSGGVPSRLIDLGGARLVQLPPVQASAGAFSALCDEDGRPVTEARLAARRERLLATFAELRPDVVVTELFPFGRRVLAGEFRALVEAARDAARPPLLVSSIRDILVAPDKPEKVAAAHRLIEEAYDAVLVHGDRALVPLETSWPVDDALRRRLVYTGYVDTAPAPAAAAAAPDIDGGILVSGGSSAAALPLYRAALDASRLMPERPWRLLVGPAVAEPAFRDIVAAAPDHATVERGRPDFRELMRGAAVIVAQAGYNTVMDIVATRSSAVLVPYGEAGETEQPLRAAELARRGWASLIDASDLDGPRLAAAVTGRLAVPRPDFAGIDLDGAARAVAALVSLAAAKRSARQPAAAS